MIFSTNLYIRNLSLWRKKSKKCPYSELFWSVFSRIQTEYGEIRSIHNQNNSEYGRFLRIGDLRRLNQPYT